MSGAIFVESDAQAAWVAQHASGGSRSAVVALTAEAVEALETAAVPHVAVGEVSDLRPLAGELYRMNVGIVEIGRRIETFAAERLPAVRFEGPAILSGQGYALQHAVAAIATRARLIVDAARALELPSVSLFTGPVDRMFATDGYAEPPAAAVIRSSCPGLALDLLPAVQPSPTSGDRPGLFTRARNRLQLARERRSRSRAIQTAGVRATLDGFRLLLADGPRYDWAPVCAALAAMRVEMAAMTSHATAYGMWSWAYEPVLQSAASGEPRPLRSAPYMRDMEEESAIAGVVDEWVQGHRGEARLDVLGLDVFPGLLPHLRHVAACGPALARHTDGVAAAALDDFRPDAVSFVATPSLAAKRFAFAAQRRGVPVLAYQHGACYGTHLQVMQAQLEQAHADYFLTYGEGTRCLEYPQFPARATFVPVGSARIEAMAARPAAAGHRRLRVLCIAELSTENLYGTAHSLEDTRRYSLEREALTRLAGGPALQVVYRPHPHQWRESGIARWLRRAALPVEVDIVQPLERLLRAADVVVTDGSSGQAWYETLGAGVPMLAFLDPQQTRVTPEFAGDFAAACLCCRDESSFLASLTRLAEDPAAMMQELRAIDTGPFLRKYVLGAGAGTAVDRVLHVLESLPARARDAEAK